MMRQVIAKRLTESTTQNPNTFATMDVKLDAMMGLRKTLKDAGIKVSVNDFVIKAVAKALQVVPEVNSFFDAASGTVRQNEAVDVSVAVATDGGLITPIVRDADARGLSDISDSVRGLAKRARLNQLAPEEYQGGSFSVSNLGMFGISEFTAVINPPQAAILAVGGGFQRAVVSDDVPLDAHPASISESQVGLATVMTTQLTADRRVVDEATAGQFLASFRGFLENPALLVA